MQDQIIINPADTSYRNAIIDLLQSEKLPVEDLSNELPYFFMAIDNGSVIGVVGLEIYENDGLLRSLVVRKEYRDRQIAGKLITELEKTAKDIGLNGMYLLTETADKYFAKKGFEAINRNDAPVSIQQSSEFSHVCPVSAVLMKKSIR